MSELVFYNTRTRSKEKFAPLEPNKVSIYTYNPARDQFRNEPCSRFDLDYPMA